MQASSPPCPPRPFWRSRAGVVLLLVAGVAGFLLWQEHRAHLLGVLPYLLLLACPLMHVFMHHGHHGPAASSHTDREPDHDRS